MVGLVKVLRFGECGFSHSSSIVLSNLTLPILALPNLTLPMDTSCIHSVSVVDTWSVFN